MTNKLIYLAKAEKELEESVLYYEQRSIGLGQSFLVQVKKNLNYFKLSWMIS